MAQESLDFGILFESVGSEEALAIVMTEEEVVEAEEIRALREIIMDFQCPPAETYASTSIQ